MAYLPPRGVTLDQMARACRLGRITVKKLIAEGALPGYVMPNGKVVIPADAFDDFMHGRWQPRRDLATVPPGTSYLRTVPKPGERSAS